MKESGFCPKCNGKEIFTDAGMPKRGDRSSIAISSWGQLFLDVYVCSSCGFFEEYVRDEDLRSDQKRQKLTGNWKRHLR